MIFYFNWILVIEVLKCSSYPPNISSAQVIRWLFVLPNANLWARGDICVLPSAWQDSGGTQGFKLLQMATTFPQVLVVQYKWACLKSWHVASSGKFIHEIMGWLTHHGWLLLKVALYTYKISKTVKQLRSFSDPHINFNKAFSWHSSSVHSLILCDLCSFVFLS